MNKLILFVFLATSCLTFAYCDIIRDTLNAGFYIGLAEHLQSRYSEEPKIASCIIEKFEDKELERKFVSWKSLTNPQEASEDVENHIQVAEVFCRIEDFFVSPIGIVCVAFIVIALFVCICRCCLCK
ncbi:hypothetical protein ACKWTF_015755 [Chironomus riparius]